MTSGTVDRGLWECAPAFGIAGGPLTIQLTSAGVTRSFAVGAGIRPGPAVEVLRHLSALGGKAFLALRSGSRLTLTDLGRLCDGPTLAYLAGRDLVSQQRTEEGDVLCLTDRGVTACEAGEQEGIRLRARCERDARTLGHFAVSVKIPE